MYKRDLLEMGAGDLVYIPPDTVHSTKVIGDENVRTLMIFQPGGHEIHLEDEQKYTAEQRATPEILELLRSRHDYNPTDAVKEAQIANPPPPPAPGTQGPRGIRPVRKAPYPIKQRFVMHDQGETFTPKNEISTVKLTEEDTDGRYSLLDETWMPGMSAPPHSHQWHAEVFYIKEGQVEWTVGVVMNTTGAAGLSSRPNSSNGRRRGSCCAPSRISVPRNDTAQGRRCRPSPAFSRNPGSCSNARRSG